MKAIVYTSNTCKYCAIVKQYLTEQGIEIEERNISNIKFKKELMKKGYMSVPVIVINKTEIVGFKKDEIDAALGEI